MTIGSVSSKVRSPLDGFCVIGPSVRAGKPIALEFLVLAEYGP